jgi:hypothetical protein
MFEGRAKADEKAQSAKDLWRTIRALDEVLKPVLAKIELYP